MDSVVHFEMPYDDKHGEVLSSAWLEDQELGEWATTYRHDATKRAGSAEGN